MRSFSPSERRALGRAERAAWDRVCTELGARVDLLVRLGLDRRLQGRVDSEDVAQEVLMQLSASGLDPGPHGEALMAWLRRAVRHVCVDTRRRHIDAARRTLRAETSRPEFAAELHASSTTPTEAARRRERVTALHAALERLRPDDREVLVARHFEGRSLAETAERMSRTPAAVAVLQHRALARLRRHYRGGAPTECAS